MSAPSSSPRRLKRSRQSPTPTRTHRTRRVASVKDVTVNVASLFDELVVPVRALPVERGMALLVVAKPEMFAQVDLFARSVALVPKVLFYCPTSERERTFEEALHRLARRLSLRVVTLPRSFSRWVATTISLTEQTRLCERLLPYLTAEGLDTCLLPNVLEETIESFLTQWMTGFRLETLLGLQTRRVGSVQFYSPWYLTPQSDVLTYHQAMGLLTLRLRNRYRLSDPLFRQFGAMRQGFRQSIARSIRHCETSAHTVAALAKADLEASLTADSQRLALSYFSELPRARLKFALTLWLLEHEVTLSAREWESVLAQLAMQTNTVLWRNRALFLLRVGDALYLTSRDPASLKGLTASLGTASRQPDLFS